MNRSKLPERRARRGARLSIQILQAALLLALARGAAIETAQAQLPSYTARYQVEYRGRVVGSSEFALAHNEQSGVHTFSMRTRARGLLRFVRPRDFVERSEFIVQDGRIRPLEFRVEDGWRKRNPNLHMVFDWDAGRAAVARSEDDLELELQPGVLDPGSMQVALMRDIATNGHPGPYTLVNENGLLTYEFVRQEDAEVETLAGTFRAQSFRQQRAGSSRTTLIRVVPELRFLPAVIEQYRDGELYTRMVLESVEGLGLGLESDGDGP